MPPSSSHTARREFLGYKRECCRLSVSESGFYLGGGFDKWGKGSAHLTAAPASSGKARFLSPSQTHSSARILPRLAFKPPHAHPTALPNSWVGAGAPPLHQHCIFGVSPSPSPRRCAPSTRHLRAKQPSPPRTSVLGLKKAIAVLRQSVRPFPQPVVEVVLLPRGFFWGSRGPAPWHGGAGHGALQRRRVQVLQEGRQRRGLWGCPGGAVGTKQAASGGYTNFWVPPPQAGPAVLVSASLSQPHFLLISPW